MQIFGGSDADFGLGIAISGTTLYVTGDFYSKGAGIGGKGRASSSGGDDAFVLALNATTGSAVGWFGINGVQTFGGTGYDWATGIAVFGPTLYAAGTFQSTNAGIGSVGDFDSTGFGGFLLPLDISTGAAAFGTSGSPADLPTVPTIKGSVASTGVADTLTVSGTLPIPSAFPVDGAIVTINVANGITGTWTLNEKGKATASNGFATSLGIGFKFAKNAQKVNVVQADPQAKFTAVLSKGSFNPYLINAGVVFTPDRTSTCTLVIDVNFNGTIYESTLLKEFTTKKGKLTFK